MSDCTAEALIADPRMPTPRRGSPPRERIPVERASATPSRFILRRQNADGGFGTYERRRGSRAASRR